MVAVVTAVRTPVTGKIAMVTVVRTTIWVVIAGTAWTVGVSSGSGHSTGNRSNKSGNGRWDQGQ